MTDALRSEVEFLRGELEKCEEQLAWCQEDYRRLAKTVEGVELRRHQQSLRDLGGETR